MSRIFSLRGKVSCPDNGVTANHLLFDYQSGDRTKGWRVLYAYVWPKDWNKITANGQGFLALVTALATDTGKFNENEISDASENRLFAWGQQTYNMRNANIHFITPNATPLGRMNMLVDPDTIITKELYLNIGTATDEDSASLREYSYLIIVQEEKVTPAQSVFQQIKGIGQDIDT